MSYHKQQFYYLIQIQYLGFRYHGWAKQPTVKTVQGMVNKTLKYVLEDISFKTLGSSRTDAMVSANSLMLELFTNAEIKEEKLLIDLNKNLPQDIRALDISQTNEKFNIIQSAKLKEYVYMFSFGEKNHPFSAPFITSVQGDMNINIMKKAAPLFKGTHNFKQYCYKPSETTNFNRKIENCEIVKNDLYTANFFPESSYLLKVTGEGFMYHQIRLMMGALIQLGKGEVTLDEIRESLKGDKLFEQYVAPASGLILNNVTFDNQK